MRNSSFAQQSCLVFVVTVYVIVTILMVSCYKRVVADASIVYATGNNDDNENKFEYSEEFYNRYNENLSKARIYVGEYVSVNTSSERVETPGRTTRCAVYLRADSSKNAECISVVPHNSFVKILGNAVNGWYPVEYEGNKGWVAANLIN